MSYTFSSSILLASPRPQPPHPSPTLSLRGLSGIIAGDVVVAVGGRTVARGADLIEELDRFQVCGVCGGGYVWICAAPVAGV